MTHHLEASKPADGSLLAGGVQALARLFGRNARRLSIETDARLRASHVRSAAFRTELY